MNELDKLYEKAVGYFVLECDIPSQGLLASDLIFVDNSSPLGARLVVATWGNTAHLCQILADGTFYDWCHHDVAPDNAVVIGKAARVLRTLPDYREELPTRLLVSP